MMLALLLKTRKRDREHTQKFDKCHEKHAN